MSKLTLLLYGPTALSWLTTAGGMAVFAIYFIAILRATHRLGTPPRCALRGAAFGAVVLPLAVWLYLQFFAGPIRALIFGFAGLVLLSHFEPFGGVAAISHAIVVDPAEGSGLALRAALLGSLAWATLYGLVVRTKWGQAFEV